MSSKGQVVIPEEIRNRLRLKAGSQFIVIGKDDVVILKTISPPSMSEFKQFIASAKKKAKEANMKSSDISAAVEEARSHK